MKRQTTWLALTLLFLASALCNASPKGEFFEAVREGNLSKTARMLSAYPKLANASDIVPPLHWAAMQGNARMARLLVERGADVRSTDQYRITPLHWAAIGASTEMLNLLISRGANVNARDKWGSTPLHWVAKCNANRALSDALIAKGASIEARDAMGRTPMHLAAIHGNSAAIEMLADRGADVNARDSSGATPLHRVESKSRPAAQMLIAKGANPNARDRHGATPLHWAAMHRAREVLLVLLSTRVDVNARTSGNWATVDSNGRTVIIPAGSSALDVAVMMQNEGVARLLKESGAVCKVTRPGMSNTRLLALHNFGRLR